jgi:Flp pilus assembly protein TadG
MAGFADQRGVAAVEFALVAPTFFLLTFLIFDAGLSMFNQAILDNAVRTASRTILTGSSTVTATSFDTALCAAAKPTIPCAKLSFSVTSATLASGFGTLSAQSPNSSGKYTCTSTNLTTCTFSPGGATDLVLVQVAYAKGFLVPWFSQILGGTGTPALVSTLAFEAEAY